MMDRRRARSDAPYPGKTSAKSHLRRHTRLKYNSLKYSNLKYNSLRYDNLRSTSAGCLGCLTIALL